MTERRDRVQPSEARFASNQAPSRQLPGWVVTGVPRPFAGISSERIAAVGLSVVGAIAVLVPVFPMGELVKPGPLPALAWLALIAVGFAGLALLRGGVSALPSGPLPLLAALFLGLHVAVTLLFGSPNLRLLALTWAIWLAAFLLASMLPRHLATTVIVVWIALAAGAACYAVYEHLSRPPILYRGNLVEEYHRLRVDVGGRRLVRAQATFGHPAALASFLVTTLALALWAFVLPRRAGAWVGRAAIVLLLIAGTAATLTRGAALALVVAVAAGLLARRVPQRVKLGIAGAAAVVALLLLPTGLGRSVIDYARDEARLTRSPGRIATVRSLDDVLSASPGHVAIGWGGGTRQELYDAGVLNAADGFEVVDNQYITLLTEVGIVGLGCFLALVGFALRIGWTAPGWWPFGLGGALLTLLTALFFYEGLIWPSTALLFWSLLGALAREQQEARR